MNIALTSSIPLLVLNARMACTDMALGMIKADPATSCNEIYKFNPLTRKTISEYWIKGKD